MNWIEGLRQRGVLAALGAALLFGAGTPLATLLLDAVSPWMLAGLLYLGAGLGLTLYRCWTRAPHVRLARSEMAWFAGAIVAGLRHLGTARTGAYFSVTPLFGAMLAVLMGEASSLQLIIAGGLMALGTWLHLTERHEHLHMHDALVHEHEHIHDEHHQHEHRIPVVPGTRHSHRHSHEPLTHTHPHFPDAHHRHRH